MRKKIRAAHELRLRKDLGVIRRFLKLIGDEDANGCWPWIGHRDPDGYGQFWLCKRSQWAYRVSYALFKQRIPAGVEIDHACHNPTCVNPAHLRRADVRQNRSRNGWHKRRHAEFGGGQSDMGRDITTEDIPI